MKTQLNEIKRMQQLAGLLNENKESINSSSIKELYIQSSNVLLEFGIQTEEGVRLLEKVLGDDSGYLSNLNTNVINKLLSSPLYPKIAEEAKKVMMALSGIEQDLKGVKLHTYYTFVLDNAEEIDKKDGPIAILDFNNNTFNPDEDIDDSFKDYLVSKGFKVNLYNVEISTFLVD